MSRFMLPAMILSSLLARTASFHSRYVLKQCHSMVKVASPSKCLRFATARYGSSRANANTISDSDKVLLVKTCRSAEDIEQLGSALAPLLQSGDVVFLNGDLGAGKTTLSRGIIRSKFEDDSMVVTSPSYLLDNSYQLDELQYIHHMDLYRLPNGADLSMLGVPQVYESSLCLIEWPERIAKAFMPQSYLTVSISVSNGDSGDKGAGGDSDECRTVTFSSNDSGRWADRLKSL